MGGRADARKGLEWEWGPRGARWIASLRGVTPCSWCAAHAGRVVQRGAENGKEVKPTAHCARKAG
eukprot:2906330-Pyramimonas_sp.AAC.1